MRRALAGLLLAAAACGPKAPPERQPSEPSTGRDSAAAAPGAPSPLPPAEAAPHPPEPDFASGRSVRVALHTDVAEVVISATGGWRLYDQNGASALLRAEGGDAWTLRPVGTDLEAVRGDGERTSRREAPFVARPVAAGTYVTVNGRPYRGDVTIRIGARGLVVVNRVSLEDYLRGVVPLEIGRRTPEERAAVEAQAIAARSYALAHLRTDAPRGYDLASTVSDQVYGGVSAETALSDDAVQRTRAQVLTFNGRVIAAPYSANCGGRTAAAGEVWREGDASYLASVSDRRKGSGDRFYCDIAPHFHWSRHYSASELAAVLARNLHSFTTVRGKIGAVTDLRIDGRTASGRVATLLIITDRGKYELHGNDIRFAFQPAGGEILPSTRLTVEVERDGDGRVTQATFSGSGNGHGVGMCQWGAIGRAREGQSASAILGAYYPGTAITRLPE